MHGISRYRPLVRLVPAWSVRPFFRPNGKRAFKAAVYHETEPLLGSASGIDRATDEISLIGIPAAGNTNLEHVPPAEFSQYGFGLAQQFSIVQIAIIPRHRI